MEAQEEQKASFKEWLASNREAETILVVKETHGKELRRSYQKDALVCLNCKHFRVAEGAEQAHAHLICVRFFETITHHSRVSCLMRNR